MTTPTTRDLREPADSGEAVEPAGADDLLAVHQRALLHMIASGTPPRRVLDHLLNAVEPTLDGGRCSILILDPNEQTLHHVSAPSLPDDYCEFIDGMSIGPTAGSCGTAAYHVTTVTVEDISVDPLWADFRQPALDADLRSCWSTPILSTDRRVLGTFAVYHDRPHVPDPTEIERFEQFSELAGIAICHTQLYARLSVSEEQFRSTFEHNAAAMVVTTTNGNLRTANQTFTDLLALDSEALAGIDLADLVDPDDAPSLRENLRQAADQGVGHANISCRLLPHNQEPVATIGTVSPLRNTHGAVTSLCLSFVDITERARAVDERIARSAAESARATAESASRSKSEFLNAMSHELRVPLTAIVGYSEILESLDLTTDRRAEAAAVISLSASHLLAIVDDVLDLARIEAGVANVSLEPVCSTTIVEEVVQLVAPIAERRTVTLHQACGSSVVVLADRRRLRQALLNVVSNAVKHGRDGGNVWISTSTGRGRVKLAVRDDGAGIAGDVRKQLFAPFSCGDHAASDAQNCGLGLAVAHQLLELMNGQITIADDRRGGTVATLTLDSAAFSSRS